MRVSGDRRRIVAFSGRSNVGKSSLVNRLLGMEVARVSRQPGCTRMIRIYEAEGYQIADLPGYGYAAVSHTERKRWQWEVQEFLLAYRPMIWVLVDSRLSPQRLDLAWVAWLEQKGLVYGILATKADLLTQKQRHHQHKVLSSAYTRSWRMSFISARSGEGVAQLHEWNLAWFSYAESNL
ncbi:MAG: ribosome biogenesis GTP-binding protein YihA/YsxC [Bacteroidia bacterium]|nr:ribosome biogenesis GTP-binding protein YihA/YsxC [Bacteroidia bacterium]MDW8235755.1 ribosome biogenesis GTP-binding protein YihA/YsxC [Bacteroidia bacterium]